MKKIAILPVCFLMIFPCYGQLTITESLFKQPTCRDSLDGAIKIKVMGGNAPYFYNWSNKNKTDSLIDILHGTYTVTVTDSSIPSINTVKSYVLENPAKLDIQFHLECEFLFTRPDEFGVALVFDSFPNPFNQSIYFNYISIEDPGSNLSYSLYDDYILLVSGDLSKKGSGNFSIKYIDKTKPYTKYGNKYRQTCSANYIIKLPENKYDIHKVKLLTPDTLFIENKEPVKAKLEVLPLSTTTLNTTKKKFIQQYQWEKSDYNGGFTKVGCKYCDTLIINEGKPSVFRFNLKSLGGCESYTYVYVVEKPIGTEKPIAFLPTAFSPNDDGYNDQLTLYGAEGVEKVVWMRVFDPWGNLVFEQKDFPAGDNHYGWDGTYKGIAANIGVYTCTYRILLRDGTERTLNNSVSLMR